MAKWKQKIVLEEPKILINDRWKAAKTSQALLGIIDNSYIYYIYYIYKNSLIDGQSVGGADFVRRSKNDIYCYEGIKMMYVWVR